MSSQKKVSFAEKKARVLILNALGINATITETPNKTFDTPTTLEEAAEQNDIAAFLRIQREMVANE